MECYASKLYNGDKIKVNKVEAAKYYKNAADQEISEDKSEYIFLFQSFLEKIYEFCCDGINNFGFNVVKNEYYIKGDDEMCQSNFKNKIISILNYSQMLSSGCGIPINLSEAEKYSRKYSKLKKLDISMKVYFENKINNLIKKVRIGDLVAIHNYALILIRGDGVEINVKEGLKYLKMAADNGNAQSMLLYGKKLFKGKGVKADQKEAIRYFKKAADEGSKEALKIIKNLCFNRKIIEMNQQEKDKYIKKLVDIIYLKMAVDAGNTEAMFIYALKYWISNEVEVDQEKSLHYFKLAADKGHIESIVQVGNFFLEQNDIDNATHYLEMAAENGNIDAMLSYGNLLCNYLNDNQKGSKYLKMAADNGSIIALDAYATYLLDNESKKEEAAKYLRKAIKFGSVHAMLNYGIMLFNGDGIEMDKRKGVEYIKKAADFGSVNAMESYVSCFVHHISENKNSDENLFNDDDVIRYQEMATKTEEPDTYLRYAELFRFGW